MAYNTPEGKVKKKGRAICRDLGLYHFPINQGGMSLGGIPDDVICVGGMFVHIEYKAHMRWDKNNKTAHKTLPTDLQCKRMEECRTSGGITFVVDDIGIEYLEQCLNVIRIYSGKYGTHIGPTYIQAKAQLLPCAWDWKLVDYLLYKENNMAIEFRTSIPHPHHYYI